MAWRPLVPLALVFLAAAAPAPRPQPGVEVVAVPDGGLQPQAAMDPGGTLHVLYFRGETMHGDLFYVRRGPAAAEFSRPVQVNSVPGSAIASGSVRGGRLALGRNGWVHIAWNGSTPLDRGVTSDTPMWYTRVSPGGTVEPQRPIGTHTRHLDGGGDVAADRRGNVRIVWHAAGQDDGETHRRIYVAASSDDGAHFAAETMFGTDGGNCGCCQLEALFDRRGRLQVLFRSAGGGVHRDAMWVTLDGAPPRVPITLQPWELPACPMTTFALGETPDGLIAVWETAQQIYTAALDPVSRQVSAPSAMSGTGSRKHPSLAINAAGDRLYAWTDGTSNTRAGSLGWELRAHDGSRVASSASAGPVAAASLVAAVAKPDGSFLILR